MPDFERSASQMLWGESTGPVSSSEIGSDQKCLPVKLKKRKQKHPSKHRMGKWTVVPGGQVARDLGKSVGGPELDGTVQTSPRMDRSSTSSKPPKLSPAVALEDTERDRDGTPKLT